MVKVCSINGCDKPHEARGYCKSHYEKHRNQGDFITKKIRDRPNHCQKKQCPAARKLYNHVLRIKNVESRRKYNKEWSLSNRELTRKRIREWVAANPERRRHLNCKFRENNVALVRSYRAKRRATLRQAMPPWLTENHISQVKVVYAEARRLEMETGIPHHVDHIVPLSADKNVCGLHVPWNLRAIPAVENLSRPRAYKDGMY
jgi:hypothetical protein